MRDNLAIIAYYGIAGLAALCLLIALIAQTHVIVRDALTHDECGPVVLCSGTLARVPGTDVLRCEPDQE